MRFSSRYFLITPKLLTRLEYHANMKILCINNGELYRRIGQRVIRILHPVILIPLGDWRESAFETCHFSGNLLMSHMISPRRERRKSLRRSQRYPVEHCEEKAGGLDASSFSRVYRFYGSNDLMMIQRLRKARYQAVSILSICKLAGIQWPQRCRFPVAVQNQEKFRDSVVLTLSCDALRPQNDSPNQDLLFDHLVVLGSFP